MKRLVVRAHHLPNHICRPTQRAASPLLRQQGILRHLFPGKSCSHSTRSHTTSQPVLNPELIIDSEMAAMTSATRPPQRDLPLQEARAALREHFTSFPDSNKGDGWAKLWDAGDFLPWDRMVPSPALTDTLDNHAQVIGSSKLVLPDGSTRRKRALVPGCGRGVDVMMLQAYGYDVVGLEYAAKAVEACEVYAQQTDKDDFYKVRNETEGKGSRTFVQGDFYTDTWLEKAGLGHLEKEGVFDLIYDYTVSPATENQMPYSHFTHSSSAPWNRRCDPHGQNACQLCWRRTHRQI